MILPEPDRRWASLVRRPWGAHVDGFEPGELPLSAELGGPSVTRPGLILQYRDPRGRLPGRTIGMTSGQAIAMLDGFLTRGLLVHRRLTAHARGYGRFRRDTIHIKPVGVS